MEDTQDNMDNEKTNLPTLEYHDNEYDLEDDDIVLSDVHIHPDNGRVDGRIMTSTFVLSTVNQNTAKDANDHKDDDKDENKDEDDESESGWDHELHIQHAMGTSLRNVGMLRIA